MENKETLAQEALRLIKDVPKEDFILNKMTDEHSKCCVVGHYIRLKSNNPMDYSHKNCTGFITAEPLLRESAAFLLSQGSSTFKTIITVNNGIQLVVYTEPEIKDRVIHLLEDMVEAGY